MRHNEEPDVNHFEVWGDRQSGLDTGNYGYNHQHQSQTHHYTVLNNLIELKMKVLKYWNMLLKYLTAKSPSSKKKVRNPMSNNIICWTKVPNIWYSIFLHLRHVNVRFFLKNEGPSKYNSDFSFTCNTWINDKQIPHLNFILKKLFLSWKKN